MGSWGPGNFECDDALEVLEEVVAVTSTEISGFLMSERVGFEDLAAVVACIAIENALTEKFPSPGRELKEARSLSSKVLDIFDAESAAFSGDTSWLSERRRQVEATLEEMLRLSKLSEE